VPDPWLTVLAWTWLGLAFASAGVMVVDMLRGYRQPMGVMDAVWPITALYLGPIALWAYWRYGRAYTERYQREHGTGMPENPHVVGVALSTAHCGSGCTLGDILAESLIFALGLTIFGAAIYASFVYDYIFAFAFGVVFQALAIASMGKVRIGILAKRTAQSDFASLTAFEVGLFAWMALTWFVFFTSPHLRPDDPEFWFMMQVGMIIGFISAYPANAWLIRRGIKDAM
jgi:hypothetical protein